MRTSGAHSATTSQLRGVFQRRIQRRYKLFWKTRRFGLHGKGRCLLTYMSREDPIEKWHCCDLWQRKLANKWNSREFAVKHGCRVPELYWCGRNPARIPFDSLPDHYVIRPVVGHSCQGVFVMANGVNLLDGQPYSPDQIVADTRSRLRPWTRRKVMVEEFVRTEQGQYRLPPEFKMHVFGGRIASLLYIDRNKPARGVHLDPDFQSLARFLSDDPESAEEPPLFTPRRYAWPSDQSLPDPPVCWDEMKRVARTLGEAYGTYVRIDLYASDKGCVFGEFTPTQSKGVTIRPALERFFSAIWDEEFPDRI
jgi:hypothetical protein